MADSKRRGSGDEFDGDDDFDEVLDEADVGDADPDAMPGRRSRSGGVRERSSPVARAKSDDSVGPIGRVLRFVREVVAELQKVIWPTRKELLTYTTVVVVFVAIMMAFIALLDVGFARAMIWVFGGSANN